MSAPKNSSPDPHKGPEAPETTTLRIEDTPNGRLLARALQIMDERGCTMGEAMDAAQGEAPHA